MRIGIVVNDIATEKPAYTTILLARTGFARGHQVYFLNVADFSYTPEDRIRVLATEAGPSDSAEAFTQALQEAAAGRGWMDTGDLDVLFLRNEPTFDAPTRPWAQPIGYLFGQSAQAMGVTVLSNPAALAMAVSDKMYTQRFPASVRPKTLITREAEEIAAFREEMDGRIVLKPLHGGAGHNVFLIEPGNGQNFHQILDVIAQHGYVIAQEYLPEAANGVVRLFLLDGKPLSRGGRYAMLRHIPSGGDIRSNYRVSGSIAEATMTEEIAAVADATGPLLAADGHFLVGLDIAGGKLLEANLFSPGGLRGAERLQGVPFSETVIEAMEEHRRQHSARQRS